MKKYPIILLALLLPVFSVFAQLKSKLRFDGIYYYDNKKDTVITDQELKNKIQNTKNNNADSLGIKNFPAKAVFYKPESRKIDLYRFYEDGTYLAAFMNEEFNLGKASKIIDINRAADISSGKKNTYTLKGNQVYIEEKFPPLKSMTDDKGNKYYKETKIMHTGTVMQDSIRFIITNTFPPGHKYLDDTIKVFHFIPLK